MPGITITDAEVRDEHVRRNGPDVDLDPTTERVIRRDLARQRADARAAAKAPAKTEPDHLTVTVEVSHGDRVLSVTQHHVPITPTP